jgi:hypothetical protein
VKAATALKPVGLGKDPARFGLSNLRPELGMHRLGQLEVRDGAGAQPSCAGAGDRPPSGMIPANLQLAKPHSLGSPTILLPTVP